MAERQCVQACLELHPRRLCVTLLPYFPLILLNFVLYLHIYDSVYILQRYFINMEPMASHGRNHYSQKIQEAPPERALASVFKETANVHCRSNVSIPTFVYSVRDS